MTESKDSGGETKATPLSAALASMDTRAQRAAERRAQLHAAAAERVRARQQQLEEEDRYCAFHCRITALCISMLQLILALTATV